MIASLPAACRGRDSVAALKGHNAVNSLEMTSVAVFSIVQTHVMWLSAAYGHIAQPRLAPPPPEEGAIVCASCWQPAARPPNKPAKLGCVQRAQKVRDTISADPLRLEN